MNARLQDVNDFFHYRVYQFQHQNKSDDQRQSYSFQCPKRKNNHKHNNQCGRYHLYTEIPFVLENIRKAGCRVFKAFTKIFYGLSRHSLIIPHKSSFSNAKKSLLPRNNCENFFKFALIPLNLHDYFISAGRIEKNILPRQKRRSF